MSAMNDYYERHGEDIDDELEPTIRECKFCGKDGLQWEHDGDRWVLMDSKYRVHKCDPKKANAAAADDFEVLP